MTERLHFHSSLSCIGEGNGNPLQCSCLENPRDRGAWWASVYGVAQSRTQLKRLSSIAAEQLVRPSSKDPGAHSSKGKMPGCFFCTWFFCLLTHRDHSRHLWTFLWARNWVKDWEFEISKCKLVYTEWVNNKVLYSTETISISCDKTE